MVDGVASRLLDPIRPYLYAGAIVAILALCAWVWRIDSLRASHKEQAASIAREYAAFRKEMTDRTAEALAKEKEQARAADVKHAQSLADVRDDTDRFIAARSVRKAAAGCGASPAPASPGVPAEVPTQAVVDNADVRTCGDLYSYALDAYEWANGAVK